MGNNVKKNSVARAYTLDENNVVETEPTGKAGPGGIELQIPHEGQLVVYTISEEQLDKLLLHATARLVGPSSKEEEQLFELLGDNHLEILEEVEQLQKRSWVNRLYDIATNPYFLGAVAVVATAAGVAYGYTVYKQQPTTNDSDETDADTTADAGYGNGPHGPNAPHLSVA